MTSPTSSPVILRGRYGSRIRLDCGTLLWESRGVFRRIAVEAIERVETRGPKGRTLAVVLTADEAGEQAVYTLVSRSGNAVHEFAKALRGALPVRDAAEPRTNGAELVSEERMTRWKPKPRHIAGWTVGIAYTLVLTAMCNIDSLDATSAVMFWVTAPILIPIGGLLTRAGWEMVRETWVLRTRGITVEGNLRSTFSVPSGDSSTLQYEYTFTDAKGVPRKHTSADGGAERAEITYDPLAPESAQVGNQSTVRLFVSAFVLLLGVSTLVTGVYLAVAAPFIAFR